MEDSKVVIILEAARKRFAHFGISKTTMNEIAADIGMSKASLYYYFPDKEKLFVALFFTTDPLLPNQRRASLRFSSS